MSFTVVQFNYFQNVIMVIQYIVLAPKGTYGKLQIKHPCWKKKYFNRILKNHFSILAYCFSLYQQNIVNK